MLLSIVRVRHLPQLAAGRLLPDLRRQRRAAGLQLHAGGRLRGAGADGVGAERDPAAAARPAAPAASATRAACSSSRATTTRGRCCATGRARCRRTAAATARPRASLLRGQRDAEDAPARLRARGVPQPRRVQRLPAALGRAGLLRAARRCNRNYEAAADGVHGPRHPRRAAVARREEEHLRSIRRHRPPGRADCSRTSASDTPCPTPFDPQPPNTRAFCVVQGVAPHRAAAARPPGRCRRCRGHSADGVRGASARRDNLLQFDTYRGRRRPQAGRRHRRTRTARSRRSPTSRSALGPCAGLAGQDVDVRGPEWSYDGRELVFAARAGAASGLDLWLLDVAGGTLPAAHQRQRPPGQRASRSTTSIRCSRPTAAIVFASTRGRDAHAQKVPAQRGPLSGRAGARLRQPGADDVPLELRARPGVHAGRPGQFTAEKATPTSISCPDGASTGT